MEYLVKEAGAEVNATNHRGDTALSLAAFWGKVRVSLALTQDHPVYRARVLPGRCCVIDKAISTSASRYVDATVTWTTSRSLSCLGWQMDRLILNRICGLRAKAPSCTSGANHDLPVCASW